MPHRHFGRHLRRHPRRRGAVVLVEARSRADLPAVLLVAFVLAAGVLMMY